MHATLQGQQPSRCHNLPSLEESAILYAWCPFGRALKGSMLVLSNYSTTIPWSNKPTPYTVLKVCMLASTSMQARRLETLLRHPGPHHFALAEELVILRILGNVPHRSHHSNQRNHQHDDVDCSQGRLLAAGQVGVYLEMQEDSSSSRQQHQRAREQKAARRVQQWT